MNVRPWRPSGFFVMRTPLLPFTEILRWQRVGADPGEEGIDPDAAHEERCRRLRAHLRACLDRPETREAIFLASPVLHDRIPEWEKDPRGGRGPRIEASLVKYFQRMAGRCTPFGMFAGISTGILAEAGPDARRGPRESEASLRVPPLAESRRHTRLDMEYLSALTDLLNRDREIRRRLRFRPGDTLTRVGMQLRYSEARLEGRIRSYFLVEAVADEYLDRILEGAREGASLRSLAESLVDGEITFEDAEGYVHELVDAGILVSDLMPALTGGESLDDLLDRLAELEVGAPRIVLGAVRERIRAIDAAGPGGDVSLYRGLAGTLEAIPVDADISRLFQVDLHRPAPGLSLPSEALDSLLDGVEALDHLFPDRRDPLEEFRRRFVERYGDREVSLLEALDSEAGLGFGRDTRDLAADPSPLIQGLPLSGAAGDDMVPWPAALNLAAPKLAEALASGAREIVLGEDEIAGLAELRKAPLPDAFDVMGSILAPGREDGVRSIVRSVSGPSGARLLGRFCHGDPELARAVRAHLAEEEALRPEALFCEIVHQPDGRIGNVLARPALRDHELEFLGRSGLSRGQRLGLEELRVSVTDNRVRLTSVLRGCEVIPRLTTAHNVGRRGVPVYRFLSALQGQGIRGGLAWSWGPLAVLPHLPRVRFRNTLLDVASWRIRADELREAGEASGAGRFRRIQDLAHGRGIPRFAALEEGDNLLPVDFENPLSVETLMDAVRGMPGFRLREMLVEPADLAVEGPGGRYCNEVIVPMVRRREEEPTPENRPARVELEDAARASASSPLSPGSAGRDPSMPETAFPPGSEWLMVRVNTGTAGADRVLCRVVAPLARDLLREGTIDRWFFIRYQDPDFHLRVRFHGEPGDLLEKAFPRLVRGLETAVRDGRVHRVQTDTYHREMRRYGGPAGILPAEELFWHDSEACADIVGRMTGDDGQDLRWRATLAGMDALLEDWRMDLVERWRLLNALADAFAREFGVEGAARKAVLARVRRERERVDAVLDGSPQDDPRLQAVTGILARRTGNWSGAISRIRSCIGTPGFDPSEGELLGSLLHMHANRMLRSAARAQEMVLYRLLESHYDSRLSRLGVKKRDRIEGGPGAARRLAEGVES